MNFVSQDFLIFFVLVFPLYYLFKPFQVSILVIASAVFYGYEQPLLVTLLVAVSLFTSVITYIIAHSLADRRKVLIIGVAVNLLMLGFFKYKFLFFDTTKSVGYHAADLLLSIPLPIGISFFTFHAISLIVDAHRNIVTRGHIGDSFAKFAWNGFFYIAFFPQLVAGPIVKANQFFPQIGVKHFRDAPFIDAARWIIWGYFFKRFVADNLNQFTVWMDNGNFQRVGSGDLILLLFSYSAQIFADFAGYSSIAIGCAALFGYRLPINFDRPYTAVSFSDFWRRWHISLSSFLRDYLYIPLGGNRKGRLRTYFNLMATMALGGLWHGAALSFMVWGVMHGAFLVIEQMLFKNLPEKFPVKLLYSLFVFCSVSFLWLFFKLTAFSQAVEFIRLIGAAPNFLFFQAPVYALVAIYASPVVIHHLFRRELNPIWTAPVYATMLFLAIFDAGQVDAFIYFRF